MKKTCYAVFITSLMTFIFPHLSPVICIMSLLGVTYYILEDVLYQPLIPEERSE